MTPPKVCIFTIAPRNQLHAVRTLMDGVKCHAPNAHRFLLLCDKRDEFDSSMEIFETIYLDQLELPNIKHYIFQYSQPELSTAIKPIVIQLFFNKGFDKVICFDPDIAIFSSLNDLIARLDNADVLLTPHICDPIDDGKYPSECDILSFGIINPGFVAYRRNEQTQRFISWWKHNVALDCAADPREDPFYGRKLMSYAPSLCDHVSIIRHPGWSVAYWNLPTRIVEIQKSPHGNDEFFVNKEPLVFFHFSGFDAEQGILGKHQTRYTLETVSPSLRALFENYAAGLRRNGYAETKNIPFAFSQFSDGTKIPDLARKIFRENRIELVKRFRDPAGEDSPEFIRYVNEPFIINGRCSPLITRLMYAVFRRFPDLHLDEKFPDVLGVHAQSFAEWFIGPGCEYHKLPEQFIQPARNALQVRSDTRKHTQRINLNKWIYQKVFQIKNYTRLYTLIPPKQREKIAALLFRRAYLNPTGNTSRNISPAMFANGINIIGHLKAESGVGEASRVMLRACINAGISTTALDFEKGVPSRQEEKLSENINSNPSHNVNLFVLNPQRVPYAVVDFESIMKGRYNISLWNWEMPEIPDSWIDSSRFFNELWAPSQFCATAFSRRLKIPVTWIPYGIYFEPPPIIGRRELGLPEKEFIFLFMFDAFSVPERKNPMGIVNAYLRAKPTFEKKSKLVIKIINGDKANDSLRDFFIAIGNEPSIILINNYLNRPDLNALFNSCDCYVSLHRSEGFGLTIAESMFLGKPVIATGWSANMDFMTQWNSVPVPYRLIQLERDYDPYCCGQWWADPDIDAAAAAMVRIVNDPDFAKSIGNQAAKDIKENFSPEKVGEIIKTRLNAIWRTFP
jgi:glycosyltransferase involved in cell wall biosynthesis